jgi:hypothetical protein
MAGKIPPQFLKNVKGATSQGGPQSGDGTKKNTKLPPWLQKKGSADQNEPPSKNPFASVTKGRPKGKGKKLSAAEKRTLLAKARRMAISNKFNKDGVDAKDIAAAKADNKKAI